MMSQRVVLPNWEIGTPEQAAEMAAEKDRIAASQFFLVRVSGQWERWRCRNCGSSHPFLTLMCVERPFPGIYEGLYGYWNTIGAYESVPSLSPRQRAKIDRLAGLFSGVDLAQRHPRTARSLQVAETDGDLGAIALGILDPVSKGVAQRLVDRINGRGLKPPLVLPGLSP